MVSRYLVALMASRVSSVSHASAGFDSWFEFATLLLLGVSKVLRFSSVSRVEKV